jgi:hypothetical protein
MPSEWNYGDAYLRHPIQLGEIAIFDDGSTVKVHDIFDPLPDFMKRADLIFVDPPWNLGNLNTFYTKAERNDYKQDFSQFYKRLFTCIGEISPRVSYVEVGKEYLADFINEMRLLYPAVTFYNSFYYHQKGNICYVVKGAKKRAKMPLDYMDEEDIINYICEHEDYSCIGDLCIGRGLVGIGAIKNKKQFVGTELNRKRVAVMLERIVQTGIPYKKWERK